MRFSCSHGVCAAAAAALALAAPGAPLESETRHWPQFRGPAGNGVAEGEHLPERWSTTENVVWRTSIPGRGWSSPIVWGARVFVTSAINSGEFKEPSTGIYGNDYVAELIKQGLSQEEVLARVRARDIEAPEESDEIDYMVYALDAATGDILWERRAHRGAPFGGRHRKNTYASETPVTDGERVYAYFGNVGLFCYTMDGDLLWSRRWPPQPIHLDIGTAASPVLHGDRVYVLHDNNEHSFLAAVDRRTGEEIWVVPRNDFGARFRSGWATPFVWQHGSRAEIVTVGQGYVVSYDLDGKELWRLGGLVGQATPTPFAAGGLLYVGTGSQGESNRPLFAVRPGASGDISLAKDETSSEFVAWHQPQAISYTPSPVVYDGRVYVVNDNGILTVFDAGTGRRVYQARVGGGGHTFSSSPWTYGGRIFCLSEEGDTFVIAAGDEYREIARNRLGEMTFATPAVAGNGLFIRTATTLYRLGRTGMPQTSGPVQP
jgi:outer membrane protein assembly factor BamB